MLFLVYPGFKLLDLAGPLQVFNDAREPCGGAPAYRIAVVSLEGLPAESDTGLPVACDPARQWYRRPVHTLLVVGGEGVATASRDSRMITCVGRLQGRAQRVASVCTGAYLLAASGLLNGRRAVTHWEHCSDLAASYPQVQVESDPIFIKDGRTWTSAGVTAGIDMALAMVKEDLGRDPALSLARSLVTYMVRPGGQAQFSAALNRQVSDRSDRFGPLHAWLLGNLDRDLSVTTLAERANMSPRNFARIYRSQTGMTPAKAVEGLRAEAARALLEESDLQIGEIARLCGFGDDERMRRVFARALGVSPLDYRLRFQVSAR